MFKDLSSRRIIKKPLRLSRTKEVEFQTLTQFKQSHRSEIKLIYAKNI